MDAITAVATAHGLDVLNSALKTTATQYQLVGAVSHDAPDDQLSVFHTEEIETSYYDDNGVLTFIIELPVAENFERYMYAIQVTDTDGAVVINAPTPKVALATGIGGTVTIKAAVTGDAGEVVFKASDYITQTEMNDLWLPPIYDAIGGRLTQGQGDARYAQLSNQSDYLDLESNLMVLRETNASTGTFIGSGNARKYRLNTEVVNNITGASLESNSDITLPSGRYYIEGFFQCIKGNLFLPRLYDFDSSSYLLNGISINGVTSSVEATGPLSRINGFITLTAETTLQMLVHMSHTSSVVSGNDPGHGIDNIYNELKIRKIGD